MVVADGNLQQPGIQHWWRRWLCVVILKLSSWRPQKKTTGKRLSGYNMYIASRTQELQSDSSVRVLAVRSHWMHFSHDVAALHCSLHRI